MKNVFIAWALSIALSVGSAFAGTQLQMTGAGTGVSSGGGCSQATAFIARETSHTNDAIYTTMICGLVTDGVWAKLDLLYIFAGLNSTDALLNFTGAVTTSLSATAPTFTAGTGFLGNGTSASINVTGYSYSTGTNYTTSSASIFGWSTESGSDNGFIVGNSVNFASNIFLQPFSFGLTGQAAVNGGTAVTSTTLSNGLGLFTASLVSGTLTFYQNTTSSGSTPTIATAPGAANPWFLGTNGLGWFGGNVAAGGVGGALTSTDVANLYGRIHTALHAINPTTFP